MQTVSPTYNPYPRERWSNASVVFGLVDIDAKDHATPSATGEAEISKIEQTHDDITAMTNKIGTLEFNQILLDGSYRFPDIANGQVGWWSGALSGPNNVFDIPQVLEFVFSQAESSVGFTIIFDDKANEYPSEFMIESFNASNALINSETVTGNTKHTYISETPSDGYTRLKLTFTKTHKPYRRVRVCEVIFGIIQTFDKDNLSELTILNELSPDMSSLPSNEMTVTIENIEKKYNMINPTGLYKYLQEGQALDVNIGVGETGNIEQINTGKYYFTKSSSEDSSMTAQITANDRFHTLDGSMCRIGATGTWTTLEALNAVILDSGLDISVDIPSVIANRIIKKCIPQETSHRQAIRMIAQASMSVCYFTRDDVLRFVELSEGIEVDTLDGENLYLPPKISVGERINVIEVVSKDEYTLGDDGKPEPTENIYTASNKVVGETDKVKKIDSPLANGDDVAGWLLMVYAERIAFETQERGNPAVELSDTIRLYDAYGENRNAIITRQEYKFDGGLKGTTKGRVV